MTRRLPPLSALPSFEATARLGSITAAAAELGRTHSAVSKQISHLSDDLGGGLFEKAGTGLRLTARGARLHRMLSGMLDDLDGLSQALRAEINERQIDIVASATLATRWLIPHIQHFYTLHPEVDIRLHMPGPSRLPDHEFDIVLSYDRLRTNVLDMEALVLGDTWFGPVCSPSYPLSRTEKGWEAPVCLFQSGARNTWRHWEQLSGVSIAFDKESEHAHHFMAIEAAAASLGMAMAEYRLVQHDLSSGRLLAPMGFQKIPDGFQTLVMPRAKERKIVTALLQWLRYISSGQPPAA